MKYVVTPKGKPMKTHGSEFEADNVNDLVDILLDIGERKTYVPKTLRVWNKSMNLYFTLHLGGVNA